jgi:hypothetical protein
VLRSGFLHNWTIERSKPDSNNVISCFFSTWQRKTRCWWLLLSMSNRATFECLLWEKGEWKEWSLTESPPNCTQSRAKQLWMVTMGVQPQQWLFKGWQNLIGRHFENNVHTILVI